MMQSNTIIAMLLIVVILLVLIILALIVLVMHITKTNQKDKQELKAENKDLLNRVIAKNTNDYKELTHVADPKEQPKRKSLEDQLIEEGALMEGYPSPYPREL